MIVGLLYRFVNRKISKSICDYFTNLLRLEVDIWEWLRYPLWESVWMIGKTSATGFWRNCIFSWSLTASGVPRCKETYENRGKYFEKIDGFSLDDVYNALDLIAENEEAMQAWIYKRSLKICKRGPEKNRRPDPTVGMGLLIDRNGIPLAYDLFPGNESEKVHMRPILNRVKTDFSDGRTIIVADRGLNTSDNIYFTNGDNKGEVNKRDGYVYGQSVRGASGEFKNQFIRYDDVIEACSKAFDKELNRKYLSRQEVQRLLRY